MSAGRSIAVQNFNENLSILVMLAVYSLLIHLNFSVQAAMVMFGAFVALSMFCVIAATRKRATVCILSAKTFVTNIASNIPKPLSIEFLRNARQFPLSGVFLFSIQTFVD